MFSKLINYIFFIDDKKKEIEPKYFYDFKLYLSDGTLFLEEKSVKVVHWSNNIYFLYDKDTNAKKKIHKGNDMLLIMDNQVSSDKF